MVTTLLELAGTERVAEIRRGLQNTMDLNAQASHRTDETLEQAEEDIIALKARYANG